MNITELNTEVLADTGRPDKIALIARSVNAAIYKAHEIDFFPRDRVEDNNVAGIDTSNTQLLALPTRWRKFELIEPLTSAGVSQGIKFKLVSIDDTRHFDEEDEKADYYHVIGENVRIMAVNDIDRLRWVYYQYPDISVVTNDTWLTRLYPQAIVDLATAMVLKRLGDQEGYRSAMDSWSNPRDGGWKGQIHQHLIEQL